MEPQAEKWKNRRVKTPTVLQMEAAECGAAALGIVLGHYGRFVPLEELRVEIGVSRDGSKAGNMVKAARRYGLEAKGYRKEPEDVRLLDLPVILFWNFNHFVVLEGIRGDRVYINDPAAGPRTVSYAEFDKAFTGVLLAFRPGPDFQPGGRPPGLWRSIKGRLAGSRTGLLFSVLAGLFLVLPGLALPLFTKVFVDQILVAEMTSWLGPLILAMAGTAVVRGLLTWLQRRCLLRLEMRMALTGATRFMQHVLHLPIPFFTQRFPGDIAARVRISDRVAGLLSGDLAESSINAAAAVFFAGVMFLYDPVLALIGLAAALMNIGLLKAVTRRRNDLSLRLQQETGKLWGVSVSGLSLIETLKAAGMENGFFARWAGFHTKVVNARQALAPSNRLLTAGPGILMALANTAVLTVGSLKVMDGRMSMGMLAAFQTLMMSFLLPVNRLTGYGGRFQEASGDLGRLDDVLRHKKAPVFARSPADESADRPWGKLTGRVELVGLTFGYNPLSPPLIEDFHLTIAPGSRVALVGGSGSGKSTIARLTAGLFQPWSGEVRIDGRPLDEIPRPIRADSLALVDQDIRLFEGTVKENIALWNPAISEAEVVQAAKDAVIHYEIAGRRGGYQSPVEESGRNFSGGQRQRIEIARALAAGPSVLILDEATSALDPATEERVDRSLRRRGMTCLIVAHRLSTIRDCDEIVVLERGRVVERGAHEELLSSGGAYARLIGD